MADELQHLTTPLTRGSALGIDFYRLNVLETDGYREFSYAAAPVIHSYSPRPLAAFALVALQQTLPLTLRINEERYPIIRYLTVQRLDDDLCSDEDRHDNGEMIGFRPTIKPHYAVAPFNHEGPVYEHECPMRLRLNTVEGPRVLFDDTQPVIAHDGLASPAVSIDALKHEMILAKNQSRSLSLTSYVIDPLNRQVIITEHCLLSPLDHRLLCDALGREVEPKLTDVNHALYHETMRYNSASFDEDLAELHDMQRALGHDVSIELDQNRFNMI